MKTRALAAVAAVLAITAGTHGPTFAQTASLAPGQVSGAELQAWVDSDGLALAGISLRNACQFLAKNKNGERHLTVFCPSDTAPWTVKGQGNVTGNSWCVKFRYPDGNADEHCEEFFVLGDNKYEIRLSGLPINRAYRLIP